MVLGLQVTRDQTIIEDLMIDSLAELLGDAYLLGK